MSLHNIETRLSMCTRSMNDRTSILSQVACTCNEVWNSWSGIGGWGNYLVLFLLLYFTVLDLVEMVVSAFPPPHHHNSYYCEHRHCNRTVALEVALCEDGD